MSARTRNIYNRRWREVRQVVMERDGYLCQLRYEDCEGTARHVDHIVAWERGGAFYDLANLRAVCRRCHNKKPHRIDQVRRPSREW